MATNRQLSMFDLHYFHFHIEATFSEYLNNIQQHCYEKLDNSWWETCANEFVPILIDGTQKVEDIQKRIFEKVMAEFPEKFLTKEQSAELLEQVGGACQAFIDRYIPVCYCGDRTCDGECGVQHCGICIDCCRCYKYWD